MLFLKFKFIKLSIKIPSQLFSAVIIEMFLEHRISILNKFLKGRAMQVKYYQGKIKSEPMVKGKWK